VGEDLTVTLHRTRRQSAGVCVPRTNGPRTGCAAQSRAAPLAQRDVIEVHGARRRHPIFFRQENLCAQPRMVPRNASDDDLAGQREILRISQLPSPRPCSLSLTWQTTGAKTDPRFLPTNLIFNQPAETVNHLLAKVAHFSTGIDTPRVRVLVQFGLPSPLVVSLRLVSTTRSLERRPIV
jgi:hypothetical protein